MTSTATDKNITRKWDAETEMYHFRLRTLATDMGRFISDDPLRFGAGDVNFYRYVGNNPLNWIDPLGLFEIYINDCKTSSAKVYGATITVLGDNGVIRTVRGSSYPNPGNYYPIVAEGTYKAVYKSKGHRGESGRVPGVRLRDGAHVSTNWMNPAQDNGFYADGINIHEGDSETNRGSAGCITIHPDDWADFLEAFEEGEKGIVSILRRSWCGG